jgi:hypothetical protein
LICSTRERRAIATSPSARTAARSRSSAASASSDRPAIPSRSAHAGRAVGVEDEQRGVVRPPVADDRGLADEPPGALELRLDVRGRHVLSTSPRRRIICSPEAKPAPPIAAPSLPRSFVRAVNRVLEPVRGIARAEPLGGHGRDARPDLVEPDAEPGRLRQHRPDLRCQLLEREDATVHRLEQDVADPARRSGTQPVGVEHGRDRLRVGLQFHARGATGEIRTAGRRPSASTCAAARPHKSTAGCDRTSGRHRCRPLARIGVPDARTLPVEGCRFERRKR